jgi:AraC-like DNA-binding protein
MPRPRTGLIEHVAGTGWTRFAEGRPAAVLGGQVHGYTGYEEHSTVPLRRRELPSGRASLIISFGPRIRVIGQGEPRSFVAGVHHAPAVTEYAGDQHGVQVDLSPLAAHRLLGVPMDEVGFPVVALEDVLGPGAHRLAARLAGAPGWDARFALLDAVLARRLAETARPPAEVAWAWRRLVATDGRVPVRELIGELGWSDRRLLRAFRRHVGVPPTTLGRILRFRRAVARLEADGLTALAEVALDCGYYDQAHFNRDFRAFAGGPPSEYVRRLLPGGIGVDGSVQDRTLVHG